MKNTGKVVKRAAISLVAVLLLAQVIRLERSNPPVRSDLAPVPAKHVLQRACYNCHSNETNWPWYSNFAPVSWLVAMDVRDGRSHLNFSEWGAYDTVQRINKLGAIAEELKDEEMPPWYYAFVRRDSRLSEAERNQVLVWVEETVRQEMK